MRQFVVIVDQTMMKECPQVDGILDDPDDAVRRLAMIGRVETPEGYYNPWAALVNGQTVFAYDFNQLACAAAYKVEAYG